MQTHILLLCLKFYLSVIVQSMLHGVASDAILNASNSSDSATSSSLLNHVKFGIFVCLQIPSIVCSLYLFSQYATQPILRRSIHQHVVLVLLCTSFLFVVVPVSASEAFFFISYVRPASVTFCASWTWVHYSINVSNLILMAFACGERHWLLFRLNPMHIRRTRIICHYIPIAACLIYPSLLYFGLIFLYPCEPVYDFTQLLCMMPCYFISSTVANFDTYFNNWAPNIAIPFLSGMLFLRFLLQKRRMHIEIFQWKRDRKMVMQLLSVTALYVCMWSPLQVATIYDYIWTAGISTQFEVEYLYPLPYFIHLLYPFVILLSSPEFRWRSRAVRPHELAN